MRLPVVAGLVLLPVHLGAQEPAGPNTPEPRFKTAAELKAYVKGLLPSDVVCSGRQFEYLQCDAGIGGIVFMLHEQYEPKKSLIGFAFGVSNSSAANLSDYSKAKYEPVVQKYVVPFLKSLRVSPEVLQLCTTYTISKEGGPIILSGSYGEYLFTCSSFNQNSFIIGNNYTIKTKERPAPNPRQVPP